MGIPWRADEAALMEPKNDVQTQEEPDHILTYVITVTPSTALRRNNRGDIQPQNLGDSIETGAFRIGTQRT